MKPSESEPRNTEVVPATREQWQRPTFKKTDAKDAESGGSSAPDAFVTS